MNAEPTHDFREQAEARIVALLLGEASPFEEAAVQDLLKQDAGLAAFHEEMKRVLSLVQAASTHGSETRSTNPPPPRLSPERCQALLQKLEKPVTAPAAIVPFPFWRWHWFVPAAAAASVLGLLGLFLWFYQGNLKSRFQISNSLTGPPKNPFVGRYAYVAGSKPQPVANPERDFFYQKTPELGLDLNVNKQPAIAHQAASTRSPAQIVLPAEYAAQQGVVARGSVEFEVADREKLFANGIAPKAAEVTSRDLGAFQTLGEAGEASLRDRQSGAAHQLSLNRSAPPPAPAATPAPVPSAGTVFLPADGQSAGGRITQNVFADTDGSAPSVATVTGSVEGLSTMNEDLKQAISAHADSSQPADSAGRRTESVKLFAFKMADDNLAKERFSKAQSSAAVATNSYGAYGRRSGGGGFGGGAQDRGYSLADKSGAEPEQSWDEKKPAAGYPLSAGSMVVLPQGEAKPTGLNVDITTENGRVSTLGDTPLLGQLFGKDGADATAEANIELPEETRADREALFRSSMNKRGDVASVDSKQRVIEVAPVPAPARTNLVRKLAEEPGQAGKPAIIAPSQKAVSELGQTKEKIVEQDIRARTMWVPLPTPQPEMETRNNAFSTFSLNVSDVSFRLAAASLEKGAMPDPASIRSEEFVNAFDYRDPLPRGNARLSFAWERARYPFAHNREIVRLAIRTAARGREPGRPLNLVVALDHSGSMERADRVAIVQEAMKVLAGQLQPQDRISVILFARTAQLWVDGLAGGKPQELLNRIRELNPQGGTNLEDALALAYQTALKHFQTNGNNRVVLMTDGAANLGNVDPNALQETVETHRKKGIALDCFGIGWEGFNDDLLEVLARHGDGRYGFLNSVEVVKADFANQLAGALQVAAADVKAQVEFNPKRVTTFRQVGYARHQLTKEQFRDNTVDAAEIGAAESGNALYVIQVNPQGEGPLGVIRVRFKVPATGEYQERSWDLPFQGRVTTLDQAASSLRLAAASAAFAEWLANSPYAAEVNLGALESQLNGVVETFAPDPRPQRLAWMIRQARSISGK